LKTSAVRHAYAYHGLAPLRSFRNAIAVARPDLIVSGDDLATWHLHDLHDLERRNQAPGPLAALIERSLGSAAGFPVVRDRTAFMETAAAEGVRAPLTAVIEGVDGLRKWAAGNGFPIVLKANGTSGGRGVRVVRSLAEAESAFRELQAPPLLARALKRALIDQDMTLVRSSFLRRRSVVSAQSFVAGGEATSAIACWRGVVLASLHFEVINKFGAAGHATVLRLIENAEMQLAAQKMAKALNLSGMHGFDFMLDGKTGLPHLLEINPRATQVGHLTLGPQCDLPAALVAAVSGDALRAARKITDYKTIALFPQEWIRDPGSEFLRSGYHDVPWEEPELVWACVRSRRKQRRWYSRQPGSKPLPVVCLPDL
jgi:acetyl/propionyl-CoA carboxylase alpha subunit